jgi:pimeloyl-ACP methyl ester carboxylesterase
MAGGATSAVNSNGLSVHPRFEPAPCPFTPGADQIEGQTVRCGYVLVPENRKRPTGNWLRLAVAVFKSPVVSTRPPLIFLGGGPGTGILGLFGPGVTGALAQDLTAGRDFVLFEQRGIGPSQPALDCPELTDLQLRLIELHPTREQEVGDIVAAAFACRDRLVASGIDLAAYTTTASAADVNDVRAALGYRRLDVWGLSYGSRLALAVTKEFPGIVRSLVLESALPPSVNQVEDRAANAERAFQVLFDGCAADVACAAAYPDLETAFYELVNRLNDAPVRVPAQDTGTGAVYSVVLTGDRLIHLLIDALTDTSLIPYVPLAIASLQQGDFTLVSQAISLLWFRGGGAVGMFYSVNCSDQVNRTSVWRIRSARRNVRPEINAALGEEARLRICAGWGAARLPRSEATPVVSTVRTLILAGEYDPLTPPAYGRIAARTLLRSRWFQFPGIGHGVERTSPCAHAMMMAFLADPSRPPDASCIAGMGPPAWVIPGRQRPSNKAPNER